jgi:hypothetical protein
LDRGIALKILAPSGALTSRWTKVRSSRRLPNRKPAARSSESHASAVCITTTNVVPLDRRSVERGPDQTVKRQQHSFDRAISEAI